MKVQWYFIAKHMSGKLLKLKLKLLSFHENCFQAVVLKCCSSIRSSHRWCTIKMVSLKISQNSQENACAGVCFLIKMKALGNFIKKETLTQVFFCEICEIFKNNLLIKHLWWLLLFGQQCLQKTLIHRFNTGMPIDKEKETYSSVWLSVIKLFQLCLGLSIVVWMEPRYPGYSKTLLSLKD